MLNSFIVLSHPTLTSNTLIKVIKSSSQKVYNGNVIQSIVHKGEPICSFFEWRPRDVYITVQYDSSTFNYKITARNAIQNEKADVSKPLKQQANVTGSSRST